MFARSTFRAIILLIAVTTVSSQYLSITSYTDSKCTTQVPGILITYDPDAEGCPNGTSTKCVAYGTMNLYAITNCSAGYPGASLTDSMLVVQAFLTTDGSCTAPYSATFAVPKPGDCLPAYDSWIKLGGCETQGANITIATYDLEADCKSGSNSRTNSTGSIFSDKCTRTDVNDYYGRCPNSTTPGSPVAATPGKKSDAASGAVVGFVSVVAAVALLVLA